jgi:YVTN family beta-propeller protein
VFIYFISAFGPVCLAQSGRQSKFIYKKHEIEGSISPKSIVASGNGLFAAQNMMYRHSVTVYDKSGELLAKISDAVDLKSFGFTEYESDSYLGGPVEAAFSDNGNYLWVSNYNMIGDGFNNPGCDACNGKSYDPGFVYKINTKTFVIENAVKVGAVPKFLAISKDEKLMIVSNWSSSDISIIDMTSEKEVKKVDVGAHPRGVAISSDSKKAYITVMGSTKIAIVDLVTYEVSYITGIGSSPRHLVLSANDSLLYISLNSGNSLVKYELATGKKQCCKTNAGPRTMILSPDQKYLYVVNYFSNTFSKIRSDSMTVVEVVETGHHPIGITANWTDSEIWVACYEGKIEIFKDFALAQSSATETFLFEEELTAFLNLFQPKMTSSPETTQVVAGPSTSSVENDPTTSNVPDDEETTLETDVAEVVAVQKTVYTPRLKSTGVSEADRNRFAGAEQDTDVEPAVNITATKTNTTGCAYHVIVGSFSIPENATAFKTTVGKKGYPATLIEGKGLTYVSAQCFSTREDAAAAISSIHADIDVKGWVLKH